jgi:hypothetical protein
MSRPTLFGTTSTAFTIALTVATTHVASAATVNVTGNVNISALGISADDTDIIFAGDHTLTIDTTLAFKISSINADGNNAVINFSGTNKIRLANSAGTVVIQEGLGSGSITITGGAAGAGFSATLETGETIDVRATIDEAVAGNTWLIGNNTLLLSTSGAEVGAVEIGFDGGGAKLDIDDDAEVASITPTGDFTIDVSTAKTLTVSGAATAIGDNTLTLIGGSSTSAIVAASGFNLDNSSSAINVNSAITLDDLNVSANGTITLADGVTLTLSDSVQLGANTLTFMGTGGTGGETVVATNGITINNADSLLVVDGDTANTFTISKVDITGADLNAGKGLDINQNTSVTALAISQNATLDVAPGKTLSGTATLNAAKTLTINNTGTINAITATTAASTVNMTAAGTITTLTSAFAANTIDIDESAAITNLAVNANATLSVATGKTLTTTATVAASQILTTNQAGAVTTITLNGANAELNITTASPTISTLNVNADGGVLDVDVDCAITTCNLISGQGDLTLQHGSRSITSSTGFNLNNNELKLNEDGGVLSKVNMNAAGAVLDVNESNTVTTLTVAAAVTADITSAKTLTAAVDVVAGGVFELTSSGAVTTVNLNGANAELQMTGAGQVNTLNIFADGAVLDVNSTSTISNVNMTAGIGDLTLEIPSGKTLVGTIDVNNNTLTLTDIGRPGTINMDTDGGAIDLNASANPTALNISADVTIDVADATTLSGTVSIQDNTLTLLGAGTLARVDATTGTIIADATTTISDLRPNFGNAGVFTYSGTGASTVTRLDNATVGTGDTFRKAGTGTLTITNGIAEFFTDATTAKFDINEGTVVVGTASANNDITFNDDGDEITLAADAQITLYGNLTVSQAGTNTNFDAEPGSIINLAASAPKTITAAADNDFSPLGTVNLNGTDSDYAFAGAFDFSFGHININTTAALINTVAGSSILFTPNARVEIAGDGTLTVDAGESNSKIILDTTTSQGAFTLDRGTSSNVTIQNARVANSTYTSDNRDSALTEIGLQGVSDGGGNTNWFSRADVEDEEDPDDMDDPDSATDDDTTDDDMTDDDEDDLPEDDLPVDVETTVGQVASIDRNGNASGGASLSRNGAAALVDVTRATSGSFFVTIADGNLRPDFDGIPNQTALATTMRVTSSLTGDFDVTIQLCYNDDMLDDAALTEDQLVLYTYLEPDGPWTLAGALGQYQGDAEPTGVRGDYGYNSRTQCVWAVRDRLSDFAAGAGDSTSIPDGGNDPNGESPDNGTGTPPARTGLCGTLGLIPFTMMGLGLLTLTHQNRRRESPQTRN